MTAIRIEVLGVPVPQGSTRSFALKKDGAYTGRTATTSDNPKLRAWRDLVAKAASDAMMQDPEYGGREILEGAVGLDLQVFLPRPKSAPKRKRLRHQKRPDLDKVIRGILDALTGVVFRDDSQVCEIKALKDYDYDHAPGIICVVYPIPDSPRERSPQPSDKEAAAPGTKGGSYSAGVDTVGSTPTAFSADAPLHTSMPPGPTPGATFSVPCKRCGGPAPSDAEHGRCDRCEADATEAY